MYFAPDADARGDPADHGDGPVLNVALETDISSYIICIIIIVIVIFFYYIKIMLESNPLKSTMIAGILGVRSSASTTPPTNSSPAPSTTRT